MCYYATTDYLCGDWKWGNMMLRCPRQHRIGETCGAKLVHHESVTKSSTICKICEEISTKQRRLCKTQDNIKRWSREPDKFSASLEKARREGQELEEKIRDLQLRRPSIATTILSASKSTCGGRSASTTAATTTVLPPVTSMAAVATSRYEYTSTPSTHRIPENGSCTIPRNGTMPGIGAVNAVSFSPNSTVSAYTNLPAGNILGRHAAGVSGTSVNVPLDRQGGSYGVSYARR